MRPLANLLLVLLPLVSGTSIAFAQDTAATRVTWEPIFDLGSDLFPSFIIATATLRPPKQPPRIVGDQFGLVGVRIVNPSAGNRFHLTVKIDSIAEPTELEGTLEDVGAYVLRPKIRYRYVALTNLRQPIPVNVSLTLRINESAEETKSETLKVRSVNDAPFAVRDSTGNARGIPWVFAAFVNENHPWIDALLQDAMRTRRVRFTGYQTGRRDDVMHQVEAIWSALQRRGIKYSSITTPSGVSDKVLSQHVRFLEDSIRYTQANCIDGTVLFASISRKISLNPIIVLLPGHALVGVYTTEDRKEAAFFETTLIERGSFPQARKAGDAKFHEYFPKKTNDPRVQMIDVEKMRALGINSISH